MNNEQSKAPGGPNEAPAEAQQQQQGQEVSAQKVGAPQPSPATAGMGSPTMIRGPTMSPMNQPPIQVIIFFIIFIKKKS